MAFTNSRKTPGTALVEPLYRPDAQVICGRAEVHSRTPPVRTRAEALRLLYGLLLRDQRAVRKPLGPGRVNAGQPPCCIQTFGSQ